MLWLYGAARFVKAALIPASRGFTGDFAAVFPSPYFARLRPDFPTNQVWEGGWYSGPMLHFLTFPLFALPKWWMVPPAWALANLIALVVSFVCVCRLAEVSPRVGWRQITVLASLWLLYQPLGTAFASGNIEIIEVAFILSAVVALQNAKDGRAGTLLGAAAMLKFLPIGFLAWCALRHRWRAVVAGGATIAIVLGLTAVTLGWKDSVLAAAMGSADGWSNAGLHELSVTSMFLHWAGVLDAAILEVTWFPSTRADVAAWAGQIASLLLASGVALALVVRRRRTIAPMEVAVLFLTMLLAVPRNHDYYYVFALVPFSLLLLQTAAARDWIAVVATSVAYVLISPPVPFSWIDRTGWFALPFMYVVNFWNLPVVGGLILWLQVTARLWSVPAEDVAQPQPWERSRRLAVSGLLLCSVLVAFVAWPRSAPTADVTTQAMQPGLRIVGPRAIAVSPAGDRLAYVSDRGTLCTRRLVDAVTSCWTEIRDARLPFFSPNGRWVAFFSGDALMRVPVAGGAGQRIATAIGGNGGSWSDDDSQPRLGRDGVIVFATTSGIVKLDTSDGRATVIAVRHPDEGVWSSPQMLPGGAALLFAVSPLGGLGEDDVTAWSLTTRQSKKVVSGNQPYFDQSSGLLVYVKSGRAFSTTFHTDTLSASAVSLPLAADVLDAGAGAQFAMSAEGTVVYAPAEPAPAVRRALLWVDRNGHAEALPIPVNAFESPRISSDGQFVAAAVRAGNSEVWMFRRSDGLARRLSSAVSGGATPVWTADGRAVTISAAGPTVMNVSPGSTRPPTVLWEAGRGDNPQPVELGGWSADGRILVGTQGGHLWWLELAATPSRSDSLWSRVGVFSGPGPEAAPVLSPDGRWVAFVAAAPGGTAVWVRPALGVGEPRQVSALPGATAPVWSRDGRELFFRHGRSLLVAPVDTTSAFSLGVARVLFEADLALATSQTRDYDAAPDGQHFVMVSAPAPEVPAGQVRVLRHWPSTLRR